MHDMVHMVCLEMSPASCRGSCPLQHHIASLQTPSLLSPVSLWVTTCIASDGSHHEPAMIVLISLQCVALHSP